MDRVNRACMTEHQNNLEHLEKTPDQPGKPGKLGIIHEKGK